MDEFVIVGYNDMVDVADAVREKVGVTDELTIREIVDNIRSIESGGNSDGMISIPELYTVTWETTNGVSISFGYIGVSKDNTLKWIYAHGTSGTVRCMEGYCDAGGTLNLETNKFPTIDDVESSSGQYPYWCRTWATKGTILINIVEDTHLIFHCSPA